MVLRRPGIAMASLMLMEEYYNDKVIRGEYYR